MLFFKILRLIATVGIFALGVSSYVAPQIAETFQEIYPQLAGQMGYKEVAKAVNVAAKPIRDRVLHQGKELYEGLGGSRHPSIHPSKSDIGQSNQFTQTATKQVNGMRAGPTWQRVVTGNEGAAEVALQSVVMGVVG